MVRTKGEDKDEQRVIDDIHRVGWHIVGIEEDREGPAFAYSIGMQYTFSHPEIIILGLNGATVMMDIINAIGEEIRKGARFQDWHESDQILQGYSCMFRTVPSDVYPDYLGYAIWFYRPSPFPVLQCVWPDSQNRFPWQPDCQTGIQVRQPILAQQTGWPFAEGKNRAVFTTNLVLEGSHPILRISHDKEGDWQFLCGTTTSVDEARIISLHNIVELHPSVSELADLPKGWVAVRDSVNSPWRRVHADN
ncbi:DUF4262 domain-containing protein [Pirellulaceae bacterium SH449]